MHHDEKVLIANYYSLVPAYLALAALNLLVNYAMSTGNKRLGRPMH